MKTIRFLLLPVLVQIMLVAPAAAQETENEIITSSGLMENNVAYPKLDKQLRFAVDFGFSYRTAKMAPGIDPDFGRKMRSGFNFGADLLYFPRQAWGFGAKFNGRIFNTESNEDNLLSRVKHKAEMYYFAPMGTWRKFDRNNKNALVLGTSMGYMSFRDKWNDTASDTYDGFGLTFEAGYDIRVGEKSFIGFKLSLISGTATIETLDPDIKGEDLSSIDFTIGLRF